MVFVGLAGKRPAQQMQLVGCVGINTRKQCGIIKFKDLNLFVYVFEGICCYVIVNPPLDILFDCCFDLVLAV